MVVARKPVGNYEGLYCKVACHPPQEKKKGFKCRKVVKVIPQKKKLPMNFFESLPECSPPSIFSKKNNKNDRSPFSLKRYDGPILPHLCLYSC